MFVAPCGYNEGQDIRTQSYEALIAGLDEAANLIENVGTSS